MPINFQPFDPNKPVRIYRRRLPHWRQDGATYFVTFREHDSLPTRFAQQLQQLRQSLLRNADNNALYLEADREYFSQMKQYLIEGHGTCRLRDPRTARIVTEALEHFAGTRYDLGAHKVLPNHVHVVVRPLPGFELDSILHAWKSYTANKINRIRNEQGRVWQPENYDRLVRDSAEFEGTGRYIREN